MIRCREQCSCSSCIKTFSSHGAGIIFRYMHALCWHTHYTGKGWQRCLCTCKHSLPQTCALEDDMSLSYVIRLVRSSAADCQHELLKENVNLEIYYSSVLCCSGQSSKIFCFLKGCVRGLRICIGTPVVKDWILFILVQSCLVWGWIIFCWKKNPTLICVFFFFL